MEKISNQSFRIKLTVVTPTFIGAGGEKEWKSGMDYIQKDKKIYVFDIGKMVALKIFKENQLAELLAKGGKEFEEVLSLKIKSDFDNFERALRYLPFDSPVNRANEVKSFIRSQFHDVPLIPGSSLKGAIRSILFKYLRKKEETRDVDVLGAFKNGGDFMRFIQVGDTELISPDKQSNATAILNTKVFNLFNLQNNKVLWRGGWKHRGGREKGYTDENFKAEGFNTLYECVTPGTSGSLTIALKKNGIKLLPNGSPYSDNKQKILNEDITFLFKIVNEHTKDYLEKELAFFKKYPAERTEEIINKIEELIRQIPSDNSSCLLKIAAGSGFHSITGNWKYEDYDNTGLNDKTGKKKYKSRKIVEYKGNLELMGFVELKVENN